MENRPGTGEPSQGSGTRSTHSPLHMVLHSARMRKASRPPLPDAVLGMLQQAVHSAEERTARPPSSPTLETLHQAANSARTRNHNTRSLSLDSLFDVVQSAEARSQAPQRSPPFGTLLQIAQSAAARNTSHPSSPVEPNSHQYPSHMSPPSLSSRSIPTDPPLSSTNAKSHKRFKSESQRGPKGPPSPTAEIPELEQGALARFFGQYKNRAPGFKYNPNKLPLLELGRLQFGFLGLKKDSPESKALYEAFGKAMVAEFGIKFGKNMDDLAAWQRLCKRIGIDPIPTTLAKARAEFRKTHVNIVELMMARIPDGEMETFDTEEELAEYTRSRPGLTFPRVFVETGGILWYLLRHIWTD